MLNKCFISHPKHNLCGKANDTNSDRSKPTSKNIEQNRVETNFKSTQDEKQRGIEIEIHWRSKQNWSRNQNSPQFSHDQLHTILCFKYFLIEWCNPKGSGLLPQDGLISFLFYFYFIIINGGTRVLHSVGFGPEPYSLHTFFS